MSDPRDARAFATRLATDEPRLDVEVANAGALVSERTLSVDGNELMPATKVLGPFLLTNLRTPCSRRGSDAGHQLGRDLDDAAPRRCTREPSARR